jgi:hypothetical protein
VEEAEEEPAMSAGLSHLAAGQLVASALEAKLNAIGGYDDILWKIRAGYLAVLYGALGLLVGTKDTQVLAAAVNSPLRWPPLILALVLLIVGFSAAAFCVDFGYLRKKLKVIAARDALVRFVVEREEISQELLGFLLRISGEARPRDFKGHPFLIEARREYKRQKYWNLRAIHFWLYGTAPAMIVGVQLARVFCWMET